MRSFSVLSRMRPHLTRTLALSALALPALFISSLARADFDADRDLVVDSADAYPCDANATAVIFAPAQGEHGFMLFEDQWPNWSDLDFNDVGLAYNYIFQVNNAGQVVKIKATFNALAAGGQFNNGMGLRIPIAANTVSSITRTIGTGAPTALTPSPIDTQLTVKLSENIRELFGNRPAQINSLPSQAPVQGETMTVEITFSSPVTLDTGAAPFDLYIFRTERQGLEIHRPEFTGTRSMDQSLFGQGNDGSGNGRNFVDRQGLPYALHLPSVTDWPQEGHPISEIFPGIVAFASSGGRTNQDFYRTGTVAQSMYVPPGGQVRPTPRFVGADHVPAETGCVQAWGLAVDFGSSRNQFAYGSAMDSQGDVYVTGYTRGAFTGFTNQGGLDLYVAKYDGDTGAELWVQQFGGSGDDIGRDIAIDPSTGDIYITGETASALDGQSNAGGMDAFVIKYNASGARQWTRLFGGGGQDTGYGIALSPAGEVFIGGGTTSNGLPGCLDPGGSINSFLAKYSAQGQRTAATQYRTDPTDGSNYNYTSDIAYDPIGQGIYSVGVERRYNEHASAAENQFIIRHDSSTLSNQWTRHIGDYGYNNGIADRRYAYAASVSADNYDGAAYITGHWYGGTSVNRWGNWTRATGDTSADVTLVKMSAAGNEQWTYTLSSTNGQDDFGEAVITRGELSGTYFTGRTAGSLPGYTNQGGFDYFVSTYDYDGNNRWLVQGGTAANDVGHVASFDTRQLGQAGPIISTKILKVIGNTTGALGGPDQGHYDVSIYQHDYRTGESGATVIAQKLGWVTGSWSTCSASCGGGTQTRAVECKRADGPTLPDSYCTETKPAASLACNTTPCFTYAWNSGSWGSCSASCGGGTQTRAVSCQRSDGQTVADSYCTGTKPGISQSCNTQTCYTYSWYSGTWGTCSANCGGGSQTRTVYCQRSDGAQMADSSCTGTKPVTAQSCNTQTCSNTPDTSDRSCKSLRASGYTTSGVYWIDPDGAGGNASFQVYCDQTTDGGGWILLMNRRHIISFRRPWGECKNGFGALSDEFWLGNEKVYQFTSRYTSELRIDFSDGAQSYVFTANTFSLGPESDYYRLHIGAPYTGPGINAYLGMNFPQFHNNMPFSTYDRTDINTCPTAYPGNGSWWYNGCVSAILTGYGYSEFGDLWGTESYQWIYPSRSAMKFREKS